MTPGSIKVARVKLDTTKVVIIIWTITMEKWYRSIRSRHLCMCLLSKERETIRNPISESVTKTRQQDLRIVKEYTGRKDEDGPGDGGRNQFGYLFTGLGHDDAASDDGADRLLQRPPLPSPAALSRSLMLFTITLQSLVPLNHVAAIRYGVTARVAGSREAEQSVSGAKAVRGKVSGAAIDIANRFASRSPLLPSLRSEPTSPATPRTSAVLSYHSHDHHHHHQSARFSIMTEMESTTNSISCPGPRSKDHSSVTTNGDSTNGSPPDQVISNGHANGIGSDSVSPADSGEETSIFDLGFELEDLYKHALRFYKGLFS